MFFTDCSTVIWGAPRHIAGAPRFVAAAPRFLPVLLGATGLVVGASRLVASAPSDSDRRQEWPPTVWCSPEIDASKFSLHILSETPGGFQWLKYILLMEVSIEPPCYRAGSADSLWSLQYRPDLFPINDLLWQMYWQRPSIKGDGFIRHIELKSNVQLRTSIEK